MELVVSLYPAVCEALPNAETDHFRTRTLHMNECAQMGVETGG